MKFAEKVKNTVKKAESSAESDSAKLYRNVLDELCSGLHELGVGARITSEKDPRKLHLYMHPPYQPNRGSSMLRFFLDGAEIVIFGETTTRLKSHEELEAWLLDFLEKPEFIESLYLLREAANDPVEARLRVSERMAYAQGDIVVVVTPPDQQKLATAQEGQTVPIEVELLQFPGNGKFDEDVHHQLLESAGIKLRVVDEAPAGEKIRLVLERVA
ncbi:MAG TPA: hypothetical protein PK156_38700 [Polyangium sp.]|nr:hypothetical protein [Polyangium sp.]